jgi:NTP pyrophosphatase (non-canonical NTP hydrolase)
LVNELAEWSNNTFGHKRKAIAPVYKLKDEVRELIDAMEKAPENWRAIENELADCLILILDASKKHGLTASGILSNARSKFEKLKTRTWGKADSNDTFQHTQKEDNTATSNQQERWVFVKEYVSEYFDNANPIPKGAYLQFVPDRWIVYNEEGLPLEVRFTSLDLLIEKGYIVKEELCCQHTSGFGNSIQEAIGALKKISALYHSDRSCSLEAQGYNEQECNQIGIDDRAAQIAIEALKKFEPINQI